MRGAEVARQQEVEAARRAKAHAVQDERQRQSGVRRSGGVHAGHTGARRRRAGASGSRGHPPLSVRPWSRRAACGVRCCAGVRVAPVRGTPVASRALAEAQVRAQPNPPNDPQTGQPGSWKKRARPPAPPAPGQPGAAKPSGYAGSGGSRRPCNRHGSRIPAARIAPTLALTRRPVCRRAAAIARCGSSRRRKPQPET